MQVWTGMRYVSGASSASSARSARSARSYKGVTRGFNRVK